MKITELEESDLLSFRFDRDKRHIEFVVLFEGTRKVKLLASDVDSVEFIYLNLYATLTTHENVPILGEVESINTDKSGFLIEGDMVTVRVNTKNWTIEDVL